MNLSNRLLVKNLVNSLAKVKSSQEQTDPCTTSILVSFVFVIVFLTFCFFVLGHRVPDNSGLGEAIAMTTFDQKHDDNKSDVDQDENETSLDP